MQKERRLLSVVQAGEQLNAVNWPLVALSGLFLFLRIFLKLRQKRSLWWDDYVLMLSWLALLLYSALWVVSLNLGYGKDPSEVPFENDTKVFVVVDVSSSLLILANLWSKTSFAITLLRLPIGRVRSWLVCILVILGTAAIGASAYFVWVQCLIADPPWGPFTGPRCMQPNVLIAYSTFVGYFSAVMDFSFVVLPWKFLWTLQMKRSEKIGVILAMGMGTFAGVAAIVKTTVFQRLYSADLTAATQVSAWGTLETAVSIMASSIPILRALVRQGSAQGVPMGYGTEETGNVTTGTVVQVDGRNVVVRRMSHATVYRASLTKLVPSPDEALAGKPKSAAEDEERQSTSFEMDSHGTEARPRDFTG